MTDTTNVDTIATPAAPANRKARRAKGKVLKSIKAKDKGTVEVTSQAQGFKLLRAANLAAANKEGGSNGTKATLKGIAQFNFETYGLDIAADKECDKYKVYKKAFNTDWEATREQAPPELRDTDALSDKTKGGSFTRICLYTMDAAKLAGVKFNKAQAEQFAAYEKNQGRNQTKGKKNETKDFKPHAKETLITLFKRGLKQDGTPKGYKVAEWNDFNADMEKWIKFHGGNVAALIADAEK